MSVARAARRTLVSTVVVGLAVSVGSPEASSRGTCEPSLTSPARAPGYADTPWPTEHADVWRTHAASTGLPGNLDRVRLATASARLPEEPVWGYVGTGDKLYVIGGSPYLLNMFTELMLGASTDRIPTLTARTLLASRRVTPYVAQIDANTMKVDVMPLTGGTAVNYTGGLLVHSNGYLYAVVRGVLHKIDRRTFTEVSSAELPLAPKESGEPNEMTTYNGIAATLDGDLILKGWASSGGGADAPGTLLRVDPDDLSIKVNIESTAIASARMAIVADAGKEYIYFPGKTESVRFLITPTSFELDDSWTATYLEPSSGDTMASSDVYVGDGVVFASNTSPQATTPMKLFSQGDSAGASLASVNAFSGDETGWNFFMMAGDPYESGVVAVQDQATGRVAGYMVCDGGTSVEKLWENDDITSSAGMAVNYRAGHLYTDDRTCSSNHTCRLDLVVLDLRTGDELARVRVRGSRPSMGQIFIGKDAVYYVAPETGERHGYVTRVTAARG